MIFSHFTIFVDKSARPKMPSLSYIRSFEGQVICY
jgi:hypothetical protein